MSISRTAAVDAASRLPVGSSARTRRGSFASARAIATRCFSPPLNARGRCASRSASPTPASNSRARDAAPPTRPGFERQRELDVFERGELAEKPEVLEHEADDLAAVTGGLVTVEGRQVAARHRKRTPLGTVEAAENRQERCLAGSGRARDRHRVAGLDIEVDAVEHDQSAFGRVVPIGQVPRVHLDTGGLVPVVRHCPTVPARVPRTAAAGLSRGWCFGAPIRVHVTDYGCVL